MEDKTPFELLAAENANLRAKLELAEERDFYRTARIARLEAELREANTHLVEARRARHHSESAGPARVVGSVAPCSARMVCHDAARHRRTCAAR